ncbi:MAG: N-formylglutamate amidohydrolase [Deltaproteobacteria bacterium]|nr:N-formylglutamate amidohydrolase [Deltaproteobacteria bacterium]
MTELSPRCEAYELRLPAGGAAPPASPLVVSVPHAGTEVPAVDARLLRASGAALLRDADALVDRLFARAPALGAPLVVARVSRYVLDINRAPDDVDLEVCPELERPARPSARGLVWRTSTEGAALLTRPLTLAELSSRIERLHTPYHGAVAALLEERRRHFGFAVLLDAHSMPSLGRPGHSDPGERRADLVPGDVRGSSCAPSLTRLVVQHFEGAGFRVKPNDPYMGGYITRAHGRPARGVHAIQLEVNRDLYLDEEQARWNEWKAGMLVPSIDALLAALVAYRP